MPRRASARNGTDPESGATERSRRRPRRRGALFRLWIEKFQITIGNRKTVNITITNFCAVRRRNARDDFALVERAALHRAVQDPLGAEVFAMRDAELIGDVFAQSLRDAGREKVLRSES